MTSTNSPYAIETLNLTKIFTLGKVKIPALCGVNMKVNHGEIVSVVGPSGSGKSTLLNMIGALDRPTGGRVLVGGKDITRFNDNVLSRFRNRRIGFVFQAYNLINRSTVAKNVEIPAIVKGTPKKIRRERVRDLLNVVGLGDKANRKPNVLSGGEQQRVAIARALINDPEFVLADEPTGNLDSKTGEEIKHLLVKINQERGATIVMVTHNLELANAASRMLVMRDGVIEKELSTGFTNEFSAD